MILLYRCCAALLNTRFDANCTASDVENRAVQVDSGDKRTLIGIYSDELIKKAEQTQGVCTDNATRR